MQKPTEIENNPRRDKAIVVKRADGAEAVLFTAPRDFNTFAWATRQAGVFAANGVVDVTEETIH